MSLRCREAKVSSFGMEKVVRKFASFTAADEADIERFRGMSGDQKLGILLELLMPENPDEAVIKRSVRVYPLAQSRKR